MQDSWTYKSARFFHWSSSCPAIGAAVASTKFPGQLSTHLTRVVFTYIPFLPVKGQNNNHGRRTLHFPGPGLSQEAVRLVSPLQSLCSMPSVDAPFKRSVVAPLRRQPADKTLSKVYSEPLVALASDSSSFSPFTPTSHSPPWEPAPGAPARSTAMPSSGSRACP
jgi:hypothetical protein